MNNKQDTREQKWQIKCLNKPCSAISLLIRGKEKGKNCNRQQNEELRILVKKTISGSKFVPSFLPVTTATAISIFYSEKKTITNNALTLVLFYVLPVSVVLVDF